MPEKAVSENTVLIAAAGTGGHVFPALAIAEKLRESSVEIIWLGTPAGIESRVVPANNFAIEFINVAGVRGKKLVYWLKAPFAVVGAVFATMKLMLRYRVTVVLVMGGYISVAAGLAAKLLRKPLLLQEQNAIPGTANKLLAPLAHTIFTGFDRAFADRSNAQWSGNPLRSQFIETIESADSKTLDGSARERYRILVVGGSLGAHALNAAVPDAISRIFQASEKISTAGVQVVHQTGRADVESVTSAYKNAGIEAEVSPFIENMAAAYQAVDLVVARSGALTVSEVAAVGVAAIFIPYPHAIDDHQTANAKCLVEAGAARLLPQERLNESVLAEQMLAILEDEKLLASMKKNAKCQARLDASEVVAEACREVLNG